MIPSYLATSLAVLTALLWPVAAQAQPYLDTDSYGWDEGSNNISGYSWTHDYGQGYSVAVISRIYSPDPENPMIDEQYGVSIPAEGSHAYVEVHGYAAQGGAYHIEGTHLYYDSYRYGCWVEGAPPSEYPVWMDDPPPPPPPPPPNVQSLEYSSDTGYVDATSGTVYVAVGTTVTFRASPSSPAQEFPSGYPVWSGTSGASGTGATTEVAFNTVSSCASDFKTVSATSNNTLTANVLVFDFDAVLTPDDNFTDRSTTGFGVGETIALSFTISPSITAGQAGGLEWHVVSGGGDLTDNDDGTGTYTVPASSGTFALAVQIKQGPSKDQSKQKSPNIVAPTGAFQERATGTGIWHIYGKPSAGHMAKTYLTPKNVSFRNIQVREEAAVVEATGIMAGANEAVHDVGSWMAVESCDAAKGCVLVSTDTVEIEVDTFGPFYPGSFNLPIPRQYKVVGSATETSFTVLTHHATVDAAGATASTKGGTGVTRAANDPTSSY